MRRITPEEVKAALQERGLRPVHGSCGDGRTTACPLAALYLRENIEISEFTNRVLGWSDNEFGPRYAFGFLEAIDDSDPAPRLKKGEYRVGYSDGLAIRAVLWPEP